MGGQQQEEETEEQQEDVEQVDDSAVVRHISATDMFHPSKQVIEVLAASPSIGPDMAYLSSSTAMIFIALYTTMRIDQRCFLLVPTSFAMNLSTFFCSFWDMMGSSSKKDAIDDPSSLVPV
jgi:hypothetical protein